VGIRAEGRETSPCAHSTRFASHPPARAPRTSDPAPPCGWRGSPSPPCCAAARRALLPRPPRSCLSTEQAFRPCIATDPRTPLSPIRAVRCSSRCSRSCCPIVRSFDCGSMFKTAKRERSESIPTTSISSAACAARMIGRENVGAGGDEIHSRKNILVDVFGEPIRTTWLGACANALLSERARTRATIAGRAAFLLPSSQSGARWPQPSFRNRRDIKNSPPEGTVPIERRMRLTCPETGAPCRATR